MDNVQSAPPLGRCCLLDLLVRSLDKGRCCFLLDFDVCESLADFDADLNIN